MAFWKMEIGRKLGFRALADHSLTGGGKKGEGATGDNDESEEG